MGNARSIAATMCTIGLVALSRSVIAGGFALYEQSVKGLGNAFAGSAAVAEDATTLFFNPAGMARLGDSELDAAGHLIIPSLSFQDRGSHLNRAVGGAPITASDDGDGAHLALIPNLYYAHSYEERLKFGAAANIPFAFLSDYEAAGRGATMRCARTAWRSTSMPRRRIGSTSCCPWASVLTPSTSTSPSATPWFQHPVPG